MPNINKLFLRRSLKVLAEIIQLLFVHVCCIFPCYIFHVVLKSLHSLQHLLLLSVCKIFDKTLNKTVFYKLRNLGLINNLMVLLCLFQNYLSESEFNFLLLFLLILLISNISVVLRWFWHLSLILTSLH